MLSTYGLDVYTLYILHVQEVPRAEGKYNVSRNFEMDVGRIFIMNSCNSDVSEKVSMIMNCLSCEGLSFVQTLTDNEQEMCRMSKSLFEVLSEEF